MISRINSKLIFLAVASSIFIKCSSLMPEQAGNTSQTGNGMIAGMLYGPDGKTPAVGAMVYLREKHTLADTSSGYNTSGTLDTVITGSDGRFFISSNDTGMYVIEADDGNYNLAFNDSVYVKHADSTVQLSPDTLKPAGAIKGVIRLVEGGDPRKVFVLAFGIDRFVRVEANGTFKFAGLAEGNYDLRLISSLDDYGVLDTVNIPVISTDTTDLDTIDLPFTGIPIPKDVTISYDTLKQIVSLQWDKADTALVASYNVYRRNVDSNTVTALINASPVTDIIYRDSTGVQDQTYEYKVTALDNLGNEGKLGSGVSVKVLGAFEITDSIVKGHTNADGSFGGMARGVCDAKGSYYITDVSNGWLQKLDSTGNFIFKIDTFQVPVSVSIYADSFLYVCDDDAQKIVRTDLDGNVNRIFTSVGRPGGVCTRNDTVFVSSDSGIGIHNLDGDLLSFIQFQFYRWLSQPQVISMSDGKLYVIEDRGLFEVDLLLSSVREIWSFGDYEDQVENQQAQLTSYNGDTLVIAVTVSGNSGKIYLVDRYGGLIGKWYTSYPLTGITLSLRGGLICFSPGKILFLE